MTKALIFRRYLVKACAMQYKKQQNIYQVNQIKRQNNIRFPIESAIEALHQQLIHNSNLDNADDDKTSTLAQEQQGQGSECSRFQEEQAHIEQSCIIRNLDYSFYIHRERNEKKVYAHIEEKISVQDDLRNCQSRAPLLFKNVKAYTPIAVDIWMEDLCLERHLK